MAATQGRGPRQAGRIVWALVLAAATWASPLDVRAHGTGSRWLEGEAHPLAVLFHYSTGEPMSWVGIKVYGPGDAQMEFQSARTDREGRFAFVPDKPGQWRVEALDDEGHKAVAETEVSAAGGGSAGLAAGGQAGGQAGGGAAAQWRSAALGVSLIFNLYCWLSLRRKSRSAA